MPAIAVVNNIDVAVATDPDAIRDALYRQAFGPVRWVECVQAIRARGVTTIVECGPGKVLAGMTKRIDAGITGFGVTERTQSMHANIIYSPFPKLDLGAELIYGQRSLEDDREGDLKRLHTTVKYTF